MTAWAFLEVIPAPGIIPTKGVSDVIPAKLVPDPDPRAFETRREHLSADTGALVQRGLMERSGIIEWLDERLDDPRNPDSTVYPMAELLRTHRLLLGQRWRSTRNLSGLFKSRLDGFRLRASGLVGRDGFPLSRE